MDPREYYAAGILTWYSSQDGTRFYARSLRRWSEEDFPGRAFLADDQLFDKAVALLVDAGILEYVDDPYGPHMVEFKMDFPLSFMAENHASSVFAKADRFGQRWMEDALLALNDELARPSADAEEISDDIWEPLPLETSEAETIAVIEGAETALAGIKADNGFAAQFPAERDNLVNHAEATIASAKEGTATKTQVKENLIRAGKWLFDKFGGTAIGSLGGELMKWGLRMLGLL